MTLAYSYIRMSRPEQLKGDSLRRQLEKTRAYAADHNLHLDESLALKDIGISAYRGKQRMKGALAGFLTLVEEKKIPKGSYLLVENVDRLSREQVNVALQMFLSIINADIVIVTLSDKNVYSRDTIGADFTKLIMSIVFMAKAHQESVDKGYRVAEAWGDRRKRIALGEAIKLTARAPAWLRLRADRTQFDINPERAAVVRRIFADAADGLGSMSITRALNDEKIKPFGRSKGWHVSSVKKILANEAVFGRMQPHTLRDGKRMPIGEPLSKYFPKIVSEQDFWRARGAIEQRRVNGQGRHGAKFTNLFSQLLHCRCGARMSVLNKGAGTKGGVYLQCSSAGRHAGCRNKHLFRMDEFEEQMLISLAQTNLQHPFSERGEEQSKLASELNEVEAKISQLKRRIERYALLMAEDEQDIDDAFVARAKEARNALKQLAAEHRSLKRKLQTSEATQSVADNVIEKIGIYVSHIGALADDDAVYRERARMAQHFKRLVSHVEFWGNGALVTYVGGTERGLLLLHGDKVPDGVPYLVLRTEDGKTTDPNA